MNIQVPATPFTVSSACALAAAAVASAYRVPRHDLHAPSRCRAPVAHARQAAIYLAHVTFGVDVTALAHAFRRDRTTVRHACKRIEDARDDRGIDLRLAYLEQASRCFLRSITDEVAPSARHFERAGG